MAGTENYPAKFLRDVARTSFETLPQREQSFIRDQSHRYRFSQQELRQIVNIAVDLAAWNESSIMDAWPSDALPRLDVNAVKRRILKHLRTVWIDKKSSPPDYAKFGAHTKPISAKPTLANLSRGKLGLGRCPVASMRTRCCNLMTLDVVENCGFGCSYCSIQSFYRGDAINFDTGLSKKLAALRLDPNRIYHIGTGQSSDSLLWGNTNHVLDTLISFAEKNPNVILELKTKSKNISFFLKNPIPPNILCTWSLNTPTIISHEEHQTASLADRLSAARRLADRGILVGFHFHPIVRYAGWRSEYGKMFEQVQQQFRPSEVAMASLGTLTFTKAVIRAIRSRNVKTKILQTTLVDSDGKLSYPESTKLDLFRFAYTALEHWHEEVFFYLCMENPRLWKPVFGYSYRSNDDFECAMKTSYVNKIRSRHPRFYQRSPPSVSSP